MKQASIYFDKDKYFNDKPMADYLMEFLQDQNVLGATIFRGEAGFGESRTIKRPGQLFSFDEPPMVIVFIDEDEKVNKALAALRKKVKTGFIVVNQVEIWK
jgi:PII-like signaling protein